MKPLLIFGLSGTLVERVHVRNALPPNMPEPDLTVGLSKVWLRPHMLDTLLRLQETCHLAIWSSTTARNTNPLVEAVFRNPKFFPELAKQEAATPSEKEEAAAATTTAASSSRFKTSKKGEGAAHKEARKVESPIKLQFVWSREQTSADDFRRNNASVRDDAHATLKDLSSVFTVFKDIATPANTILIDDTPSKARMHAANFIWIDTCEGELIKDVTCMPKLRSFIEEQIVPAKDVRDVLPYRIRRN